MIAHHIVVSNIARVRRQGAFVDTAWLLEEMGGGGVSSCA